MRVLLRAIAAWALFAAGAATAQEDVVVRWTRLEAAPFIETTPSSAIGPIEGTTDQFIAPSGKLRTVGKGFAMVNLRTGFLSFRMEGLSNGQTLAGTAIGAPVAGGLRGNVMATVVCYATRPGYVVFVDTPRIVLDETGSGSFEGFVSLPWQCADAPAQMVFLVRHDNPGTGPHGTYMVYGAGRVIVP